MTTITKERIELFIKSPLENGLTRGEQMEVARIALASLEADPIGEVSEKRYGLIMDGTVDLGGKSTYRIIKGEKAMKLFPLGTKFYTAPPAPVSVPAAMEIDDDFDSAFEHGKAVGWNAYRAAMLQAEPVSNSDELPLDYLQGHKDGLEWAAQLAEANHPQTGDWLYDDQIELARAIRKGPDMPTVQGGNSPVTPDGWISCSEQMPSAGEQVLAYRPDAPESNDPLIKMATYVGGSAHGHGFDCYCKPTHWMPLPAAPQLEVNRG
ncbi:DUF551 domain-containing protein [Salmonella enterica subsp. enterica serovar Fresno]|nr:DUF551 domain-containing protein [Salmonella enterica subsp. enterica serovar Fresno]EBY4496273.1 DUF551 domain-containing protein [Salmonella enterica subsp. enterica serovar Fresno]